MFFYAYQVQELSQDGKVIIEMNKMTFQGVCLRNKEFLQHKYLAFVMLFKYFFPIIILTTPREGSFMTPSTANCFSLITSPLTDLDLYTILQIIIEMTVVIEMLIRNPLYINIYFGNNKIYHHYIRQNTKVMIW